MKGLQKPPSSGHTGPFPEVENSLGLSSKIKGLQRSLRADCYVPSF